jgi:hypothetical protein
VPTVGTDSACNPDDGRRKSSRDVAIQASEGEQHLVGKRSESELIQLWEDWSAAEDRYLQRDDPAQYCDLVIDGTKPFEDQLALD